VTAREQFRNLDFDQLVEKLAGYAGSRVTQELILAVDVVFHPARIDANLDQTAEALRFLDEKSSVELPAFGSIADLTPLWRRMAAGELVDSHEARQLLSYFTVCSQYGQLLKHITLEESPRLAEVAAAWQPLDQLASLTERLFNEDGEVRDGASHELSQIRSKLRRFESQVTRLLSESLPGLKQHSGDDAQVTIRGNRFVVLLPRTAAAAYDGAVVDVSGSGQSVYFEPLSISALNTERQDLFVAERQEVRRILAEYSQQVAAQHSQLSANLAIMVKTDYVFARARFARTLEATRPQLSHDRGFALSAARHPLIADFVPEDLTFDTERCLVISGVNAGGKTVLLKLLGLYTLMATLGCFVPGEATLPYVSGLLADIGDEQNALANLSTFTAHLQFITELWSRLDEHQDGELPLLVLIDEIGTGTEPGEGAAFAFGLLTALLEQPVKLAVTTHYDVLKTLAFDRQDVKNVCLEFDREQLKPTFRILDDQPGQSYALAIAQQWGVAADILEGAQSVLGQEERRMGAVIGELEELRREAELQRSAAVRHADELVAATSRNVELTAELKESKQQFARHVERVRQELEQRIDELLAETKLKLKKKARQSARKHDEYVKAASKSSGVARRQKDEVEAMVEDVLEALAIDPERDKEAPPTLTVGDLVEISGSGLRGEIATLDQDRGTAVLSVQGKRMTLALEKLRRVSAAAAASADPLQAYRSRQHLQSPYDQSGGKPELQDSSNTLDLHGQTTEEAAESLDAFLSRCLLAGIGEIRVMHGVGTGRLRQFVRDYLRSTPYVSNVRQADTHDGGVGVTLADIV